MTGENVIKLSPHKNNSNSRKNTIQLMESIYANYGVYVACSLGPRPTLLVLKSKKVYRLKPLEI